MAGKKIVDWIWNDCTGLPSAKKIFFHLCLSYVSWAAPSATPEGESWVRSRHLLGGATKTTSLHFTKSDLFRTISIFVFVQTGHFELIISDRVSPSGRDFLRKRYLEGELRDGEDLPNCYDQVRQKNTSPQKLRSRGSPSPLVHSV